MDKINKEELINIIKKSLPNLITVTGGMGISYGKSKIFFQKAKEAAQTKKIIRDKDQYWIPLLIKDKTQLVFGIESSSNPVNEIELINGLYQEFKYEIFLRKQVEKFREPKSGLIKKILLTNEIENMEQAIDSADIVGLNLRSPQAIILIKIPGFLKKAQQKCESISEEQCAASIQKECAKVTKVISNGFKNYDQNITTYLESDMFVVLKWAKGPVNTLNTINFYKKKAQYINSLIKKNLSLNAVIGVGQYYPGLKGLKKSYDDAKTALALGERIYGDRNVYHITDIGMLVSLSEEVNFDRKCELAHQQLGSIISDKDLFKTVKVFLETNMNLTDAAKRLHLHRNTLIYRLDRIKEEIGLDPRKFQDAVQIKLGLMLYSPLVTNCLNTEKRKTLRRKSDITSGRPIKDI